MVSWLIDLIDYMEQSFWPGPRIDWLMDGLIDWLMDCLMDWLMDWLNLTWFQGVVIWLIVLLIDGLVVKLINWLIASEFLTWFQGVVIWLIDWLIDWIIYGWMDWLMDCLRVSDLVPGCGEPQAVQPLLPQHKIVFNLKEDKCVRFRLFLFKRVKNIMWPVLFSPLLLSDQKKQAPKSQIKHFHMVFWLISYHIT